MPAAAVPLSPWTDLTQSGKSYYYNHGRCQYITKGYLDWASKLYLDGQDPKHPLASPLFAETLAGLPPMLIIAGGHETMLEDATRLAAKAAADGCEVLCEIYPGVSHGFMLGGVRSAYTPWRYLAGRGGPVCSRTCYIDCCFLTAYLTRC